MLLKACLVVMLAALVVGEVIPEGIADCIDCKPWTLSEYSQCEGTDEDELDMFYEALKDETRTAVVQLLGTTRGNVTFTQTGTGPVTITGIVEGLTPGQQHGFHIHEKGDISSCMNAGGHYNPFGKNHGGPTDKERHVGDLGNIQADGNGIAHISKTDSVVSLVGPYSVIGRAVVVHSGTDDLGKGGQSDSLTTGHAGSRLTCGVIGIK